MDHLPAAAVVILAAGAGTRMKSATPKVLHSVAGRTLLGHAIAAGREVNPSRLCVVVRHERDQVAADALAFDDTVLIADQDDVPGTGRAVQCALDRLVQDGVELHGPVIVTAADTPMLDGGILSELMHSHVADGNAVTVLTTHLANPTGYGRIVRESGAVVGIVEEKDATDEERAITEVNAAVYVFEADVLEQALHNVDQANAQGEIYLTDVVRIAHEQGLRVQGIAVDDSWSVEGANDKVQLAALAKEMNRRILESWMREGVTIVDPDSTWIDVDVDLAPDVTILPGVQLHGACRIESEATIGPASTLSDVEVGRGATVVRTHGSLAVIGPWASVGPFAYLRPGTYVGEGAKVGAFVETRNATIGNGARVPRLSYVADTAIGQDTDVSAGTGLDGPGPCDPADSATQESTEEGTRA